MPIPIPMPGRETGPAVRPGCGIDLRPIWPSSFMYRQSRSTGFSRNRAPGERNSRCESHRPAGRALRGTWPDRLLGDSRGFAQFLRGRKAQNASAFCRTAARRATEVRSFRSGKPTKSIVNSGWKRARNRAGLPKVRAHDLRHTFGHRLRAAGVSYEDRQDLLGHKSDRITTHYSAPGIARLFEAAESVCVRRPNTVLRIAAHTNLTQCEDSASAVKEGCS